MCMQLAIYGNGDGADDGDYTMAIAIAMTMTMMVTMMAVMMVTMMMVALFHTGCHVHSCPIQCSRPHPHSLNIVAINVSSHFSWADSAVLDPLHEPGDTQRHAEESS